MLIAGFDPGLDGTIVQIDAATFLLPGSGVRQAYRRKLSQPGRVLAWELGL
jgi:hypothetical protein